MRRWKKLVPLFAAFLSLNAPVGSSAQEVTRVASAALLAGSRVTAILTGRIITPASSITRSADAGRFVHTNFRVFQPVDAELPVFPDNGSSPRIGPPYPGRHVETPASLACIYRLVKAVAGCDPDTLIAHAVGGSKVVVVTVAYHYPTALADLTRYSNRFGLPLPNLTVVPLGATQVDANWNLEAALDLQMVHALAPSARLILVEAPSNSLNAMMAAIDTARSYALQAGGGQINGSWGTNEFSAEAAFDSHFVGHKVVYFFSSGDSISTSWPAASSKVVAVGGTSTPRDAVTGLYANYETTWTSAGVGLSAYVPRPSFQDGLTAKVGTRRALPDISADANPATGVWVYYNGGWYVLGGTSVASPMIAGMVNRAGRFLESSAAQNTFMYSHVGDATTYHDVRRGRCGPGGGWAALAGVGAAAWDRCTGIGSPRGGRGL